MTAHRVPDRPRPSRHVDELAEVHDRVLALGGQLRFDRSDDPDEPLRVDADPAGHTFCVFVA